MKEIFTNIFPEFKKRIQESGIANEASRAIQDYGTGVVSQWATEPVSSDPNANGSTLKQLANIASRKDNVEKLEKDLLINVVPLLIKALI